MSDILTKKEFQIIETALRTSVNELNSLNEKDGIPGFIGEKAQEVNQVLHKVVHILIERAQYENR